VSIKQVCQALSRGQLIPGSSGDGQDLDNNRGPPRKQLPGDKIGDGYSDDDKEEKKKKKRKKDDDSDKTVLVRAAKVAMRNINQVSTLNFFLSFFSPDSASRSAGRPERELTLSFRLTDRLAGWLAGWLGETKEKKSENFAPSGSRCSLDEPDLGDDSPLRQ
jgi:hypothetical protein